MKHYHSDRVIAFVRPSTKMYVLGISLAIAAGLTKVIATVAHWLAIMQMK